MKGLHRIYKEINKQNCKKHFNIQRSKDNISFVRASTIRLSHQCETTGRCTAFKRTNYKFYFVSFFFCSYVFMTPNKNCFLSNSMIIISRISHVYMCIYVWVLMFAATWHNICSHWWNTNIEKEINPVVFTQTKKKKLKKNNLNWMLWFDCVNRKQWNALKTICPYLFALSERFVCIYAVFREKGTNTIKTMNIWII